MNIALCGAIFYFFSGDKIASVKGKRIPEMLELSARNGAKKDDQRMAGRVNKYDECVAPRLAEISEWSGVLSEKKIAKRLGVSTSSFETYKTKYPELKEALQNGKTNLITSLKEALMKKALGFRYTETKTVTKRQGDSEIVTVEEYDRYSPPDTGAAHLLLKNLDESWRNDDQATMDLKREKLSLEKDKAEADSW